MSENLPDTSPTKGVMLPGIAAIAVWMLVVALMGVFAVLNGHVPRQMGLLLVLPICTLIVVGVFGLLRMKRWGWAMVMAGAIVVALWCFFMFRLAHLPQTLIMGLLHMLFFLYLVRTEVRERMVS